MSVVLEPNGSQVLPDLRGPRATVNGWQAHCAADADYRTKYPTTAELARTLLVFAEPQPHSNHEGEPK